MISIENVKREALGLLWNGHQDEAQAMILDVIQKLEKQKAELTSLLPDAVTIAVPVVVGADGQLSMLKKEWDEEALEERRTLVIELADKQAAEFGHPISVAKIKAELDGQGFDMGVQDNRKTTAIAGILRHSGRYEKVSKGKFGPVSD